MYPAIFENRDSSFRFSLLSTSKRRAAGTINTVFQKRSPECGVLQASSLIHRLIVDGRNTEVFEFDDVIHHILFSVGNQLSYYQRFSVFICFLFCFVSSIFNQRTSIHRFFDLAILCGETIGHNVMFSAVIADPFMFRK